MKNYAYVMRVASSRDTYEITGDALRVRDESQIVRLVLKDLAKERDEDLADLDVLAFSCFETSS